MRLLLHVGTQKTGSTSIQFFFKENRERLIENGILFPETGISFNAYGRTGRSAGHYDFVTALRDNNLGIFNELRQEISEKKGIHTILLSSENFSTDLPLELISKLKVQFNQFTHVDIIIYLRRQDLYLNSLYGEYISGGWAKLTTAPQDFYLENIAGTGHIVCDYNNLLTSWASVFGRQNIAVRPYEKDQWFANDLIRDFFNAAVLSWSDRYTYPSTKFINSSSSGQQNRVIRFFNRIPMEQKYYRAAITQFYENAPLLPQPDPNRFSVSPALRLKVLQQFNKSNVKVAQAFLSRDDGRLFCEPLPKKDDRWVPVRIDDPDLVAQGISIFLEQKFIELDQNFSKHNRQFEEKIQIIKSSAWKAIEKLRLIDTFRQKQESLESEFEIYKKRWKKESERNKKNQKGKRQILQILHSHVLATYKKARGSRWQKMCRFLRSPFLNETKLLRESGLVDAHFYFEKYPESINAGLTVSEHYTRYGAQEGKDPSMSFNTKQYLVEHPDVAQDGINPLVHFILNKSGS